VSGPISIGLAWIAKHEFNSPLAFSAFITSLAIGGLAGALAAGVFKPRRRGVVMLVVSATIALGTGLLAFVTSLWSISAVLVGMAAAAGFLNVHIVAWFQQRVERAMLGRAMSVISLASIGLQPVSLALAGMAVTWSVTGMFVAAAILMLVATTIAAQYESVRAI